MASEITAAAVTMAADAMMAVAAATINFADFLNSKKTGGTYMVGARFSFINQKSLGDMKIRGVGIFFQGCKPDTAFTCPKFADSMGCHFRLSDSGK